jgi:hypothetical protein
VSKELEQRRADAKNDSEAYLATVDSLEPNIKMIDAGAFYASAAISLKRIADTIDKQPTTDDIEEVAQIISNYFEITSAGLKIINALAQAGFKIVRK